MELFLGKNSSLDIRGSFTATTANGIKLGEDGLFSATNPQNSNLLTVQPGALFRNAIQSQTAEIRSTGNLFVGQTLTLDADNITISNSTLFGTSITLNANNLILLNGAFVSTDNYGVNPGGDIKITTSSLDAVNGSVLSASSFNIGDAGSVKITATENIKFDNQSIAGSAVFAGATGNAGDVDISTHSLEILGSSSINASTFGEGNAGNIDISTDSLELLNGSFLSASTDGKGDAGSIKITATDFIKFDSASSANSGVESGAVGNGGSVDIFTHSLELLNFSFIDASTAGEGDAGSIKITATDFIKFDGTSAAIGAVFEGATGNAGDVNISTHSLEILGGSFLSASTDGKGDAGGVNIFAYSLELLDGDIDASTFGEGDAGSVKITTTDLIKFDGASFATSSGAVGNAGSVDILKNET